MTWHELLTSTLQPIDFESYLRTEAQGWLKSFHHPHPERSAYCIRQADSFVGLTDLRERVTVVEVIAEDARSMAEDRRSIPYDA